jgi:hypothetical protein
LLGLLLTVVAVLLVKTVLRVNMYLAYWRCQQVCELYNPTLQLTAAAAAVAVAGAL